jgi:magnesium transporter
VIKIYYGNVDQPLELIKEARPSSLVCVENPTKEEIDDLVGKHGLDSDMISDGLDPNEAPRIDAWQGRKYLYTRYVLPASEQQTTSAVLIVYGIDMIYVISDSKFDVIGNLLSNKTTNTNKRTQLLLQILFEITKGYKKRINIVAKRMWSVRARLNKNQIDNEDFIDFIDMEEDLNDFLSALEPMNAQLSHILSGKFIKLYEADKDLMEDVLLSNQELISLASSQLKTLKNIREAYSTITANNLNKVFKLMTSITILMGIFTMITGIYSMNIALPAAGEGYAFWIILGITGFLISIVSYLFKKNRWF